MGKKDLKKNSQNSHFLNIVFIFETSFFIVFDMYGLYDRDGILRFANSDQEACLDYAKLFELNSEHCCLMKLVFSFDKETCFNFDLNQEENNN